MGGKDSRAPESNRPESGGADKNDIREKSGLLEREKDEFARHDADRQRSRPAPNDESGDSSGDGQTNRSTKRDGYGGSGVPEDRSFDL